VVSEEDEQKKDKNKLILVQLLEALKQQNELDKKAREKQGLSTTNSDIVGSGIENKLLEIACDSKLLDSLSYRNG